MTEIIRPAQPGDETELTAMIHELAKFERASADCTDAQVMPSSSDIAANVSQLSIAAQAIRQPSWLPEMNSAKADRCPMIEVLDCSPESTCAVRTGAGGASPARRTPRTRLRGVPGKDIASSGAETSRIHSATKTGSCGAS